MFRTTVTGLILFLCASAVPAIAADPQFDASPLSASTAFSPSSPLYAKLLVPPSLEWSPAALIPPSRGAALPALYVSLAALQMYDGYTTMTGLQRGAAETNPVLGGAAANGPALWAIKGGAAVGVIYVAERLWRRHHRNQAVALMLASNGIMAAVAARNTRVLATR